MPPAHAAVLLILAAGPLCAEVTYSRDVAPLLYQHCAGCHHPNDIAPMPLMNYREVRPWAAAIKQAVVTRQMPPWKASPHVGKWSNDVSLSDREIGIVKAWVDAGAPEGNPKDLPAPPVFAEGWKIGKPDLVIPIPPRKVEGAGPDEYVYVTVPTNFAEDRWVTAAELKPGNRKIVHHAHVFVKETEAPAPANAPKSAPTPAEAYARTLMIHEGSLDWMRPDAPVIDNGCAVDDNGLLPGRKQGELGSLLASYLPGRAPDVYPEGTARKVPAGASLSFQIHYSRTTGKTEIDETAVGLLFSKEPPRQIARRMDLSNLMFRIPAGDPDHEVSECHSISKDISVTSLTPHMHLRGKAMQMVVTYPDGRRETLLDVPHYDFNWQITYRAATPIFLPKGTRIAVIGHFDNSAANKQNPDPSKPVRWGAASETEMMDGWIEYVDAAPAAAITAGKD